MKQTKQIKSYWGIILVFVAGMIAGGVVYAVARNDMINADINAATFSDMHKAPVEASSSQSIIKSKTVNNR